MVDISQVLESRIVCRRFVLHQLRFQIIIIILVQIEYSNLADDLNQVC